jgi:hypothetical protein
MKKRIRPKPGSDVSLERGAKYHRRFALLGALEAYRVLGLFVLYHPNDSRPREAIEAIRAWGLSERELKFAEVRRLSLGAHAAARSARSEAARYAARAAGQAVATWHVPTHAMGAPIYARKAIVASLRNPPRAPKR